MAEQNQNNVSELSVDLNKTRSIRTKMKHHRTSRRKLVGSDLNSFSTKSIIHTTIGFRRKDEHPMVKNRAVKTDSLHSVRSTLNKTHSITRKKSNNWSNNNFNKNVLLEMRNYSFKTIDVNNKHPTILDETKKRKNSYCKCSIWCILLCLLIGLLLIGAIIGAIVGVSIASKKTTTTTTATTLITTTVVPTICSCLCPNEAWIFDPGYIARWPFDGTLNDLTNVYNATSYNNPSFVTNGYVNQALFFNASLIQSLSTSYIPLANSSFTIEVWLKFSFSSNLSDHSILGLCPLTASYQCLYLLIRGNASNYYLYFGFFDDDCQGLTPLTSSRWMHAAFVFDITTLTQYIYLNGVLDNSCIASSPFMATTGLVTIGTVPGLIPINNMNFYQGYMDLLTITKRAKSSCEILEDATLVGCFLFDTSTMYTDSGPNSLLNNELSTSIISSGYTNQAISFNGTAYFQASSLTALGLASKAFSIVLWIQPRSMLGTIVHVSGIANGQGWCVPFLGITANGSLVAQIYHVGGALTIWGPSISLAPVWSHVVQTWSPTNGLRLYMNGTLVAYQTSFVVYAASGVSDFITLANSLNGSGYCLGGGLGFYAPGPLQGDMDDFRVYSRELTASEVSTIYYS